MAEDDEPTVPEEDFATWLSPPHAIEALSTLGRQSAVSEILRRLKTGRVHAAASLSWTSLGDLRSRDRARIPAEWWEKTYGLDQTHAHFWVAGGVSFHLKGGYRERDVTMEAFDLRFDPRDIAAIAPKPATAVAAAPAANKDAKPLPAAERQRFAALYVELFGDAATETKAVAALRACYPDHSIGRDAFLADFRAIRGRQVPGRKRKTTE